MRVPPPDSIAVAACHRNNFDEVRARRWADIKPVLAEDGGTVALQSLTLADKRKLRALQVNPRVCSRVISELGIMSSLGAKAELESLHAAGWNTLAALVCERVRNPGEAES